MDAAGPDPGSFAQERFSRGCCRPAGMWRPVDRGDRVPAVRAAPGQVIVTMPFDGDQGDHKSAVLTLLAEEPAEPDDRPALVGRLQRLCRAAERDLPACGVGVSWVSESGGLITAAASSQDSIRLCRKFQNSTIAVTSSTGAAAAGSPCSARISVVSAVQPMRR